MRSGARSGALKALAEHLRAIRKQLATARERLNDRYRLDDPGAVWAAAQAIEATAATVHGVPNDEPTPTDVREWIPHAAARDRRGHGDPDKCQGSDMNCDLAGPVPARALALLHAHPGCTTVANIRYAQALQSQQPK